MHCQMKTRQNRYRCRCQICEQHRICSPRSSVLPTAVAEGCAPTPVQELAQLQLTANGRSLRAKGISKKGRVVVKDGSDRIFKERSEVTLFSLFLFLLNEHFQIPYRVFT